ncbi:MAG: GerMN domain-containing protein [Clostridia bacterium]|nr:GerMN domain-containing protein [Clostridia bacterium]
MKRTVLIVIISLIVCLVFSGCGLLNKVRQDFDKSERTAKDNILDDPVVLIETPGDMATVADETKLITLYFADPLENKLVAEEREIPKVTGIARATMEELIKGPVGLELKSTLPAKTKLLDINVREDGLAIVDFSDDLIKDLPTTATAENLAVYSIVNTLTQFPTVQEVEMRVDGRKVDTLLGHVQLEDNLVRNTSMIK